MSALIMVVIPEQLIDLIASKNLIFDADFTALISDQNINPATFSRCHRTDVVLCLTGSSSILVVIAFFRITFGPNGYQTAGA